MPVSKPFLANLPEQTLFWANRREQKRGTRNYLATLRHAAKKNNRNSKNQICRCRNVCRSFVSLSKTYFKQSWKPSLMNLAASGPMLDLQSQNCPKSCLIARHQFPLIMVWILDLTIRTSSSLQGPPGVPGTYSDAVPKENTNATRAKKYNLKHH